MKNIHLKVNLGTFTMAMAAWVILFGYQVVYPVEPLPTAILAHLFDILSGVMLTIITSFQKEISDADYTPSTKGEPKE